MIMIRMDDYNDLALKSIASEFMKGHFDKLKQLSLYFTM